MAKHKHTFRARPCDPAGKMPLDRSRDLTGSYTTYRNFIKFVVNKKGEPGQNYVIFEWCKTLCQGDALVRSVQGVVPR